MNSIVTSAIGEKIAALTTVGSLKARATRGDRRAFEAALSRVSNVWALPVDELSNQPRRHRTPSAGRG